MLAITTILIPSALAAKEFYGKNAEAFVNNYLDEWLSEHMGHTFHDKYIDIITNTLIYSGSIINALFNASCSWITLKSIGVTLKDIYNTASRLVTMKTNIIDDIEARALTNHQLIQQRQHEITKISYHLLKLVAISSISHLANQGNIALARNEVSNKLPESTTYSWKIYLSDIINYAAIYPGIMETCNKFEQVTRSVYKQLKECLIKQGNINRVQEAIETDLNKIIQRLSNLKRNPNAITYAIQRIPDLSQPNELSAEARMKEIYNLVRHKDLDKYISNYTKLALFGTMMGTIIGYLIVGYEGTLDAFENTGKIWANACAVTGATALVGFTAYVALATSNQWNNPTHATIAKQYELSNTVYYFIESVKIMFIMTSLFSFASGTNAAYLANKSTLDTSGYTLDLWLCAAIIGTDLVNICTSFSDIDNIGYNLASLCRSKAALQSKTFHLDLNAIRSEVQQTKENLFTMPEKEQVDMLLSMSLPDKEYKYAQQNPEIKNKILLYLTDPNKSNDLAIEHSEIRRSLSENVFHLDCQI